MDKEQELTTEDQDLQVNEEVQTESIANSEEQIVEETTTESEEKAYENAWNRIDVTDDKIFESFSTNEESSKVPAEPIDDSLNTTQGTNNNIGAFMADKPVLTYKGKDIPIDTEEELITLAQKGFRMETEAAAMKPKKKILSIIDGVPMEVLQAVADIHNGNKDAISYIEKQYGIEEKKSDDPWNSPEEKPKDKNYSPTITVEDPIKNFWEDFVTNNKQQAAKVGDIYESLEEGFKSEIYKDQVFQSFVEAVGTGEFETVYPVAIKEKTLNPAMTWLQAYAHAISKMSQPGVTQKEPPVSAAAPSNNNSGRDINRGNDGDRVWNDDAYFKEVEARLFS